MKMTKKKMTDDEYCKDVERKVFAHLAYCKLEDCIFEGITTVIGELKL